MPSTNHRIQWLTISELAQAWAPALSPLPITTIERELQFGLFKVERAMDMRKPLAAPPPNDQLPPKNTLISREFVERFCSESEEWQLPEFWFHMKQLAPVPSFPGRPSVMRAIVQELEKRAEQNQLAETLGEQSRELADWAAKQFPDKQTPKAASLSNGIRVAFKGLKRGPVKRH